jgi:hypothetical protein
LLFQRSVKSTPYEEQDSCRLKGLHRWWHEAACQFECMAGIMSDGKREERGEKKKKKKKKI